MIQFTDWIHFWNASRSVRNRDLLVFAACISDPHVFWTFKQIANIMNEITIHGVACKDWINKKKNINQSGLFKQNISKMFYELAFFIGSIVCEATPAGFPFLLTLSKLCASVLSHSFYKTNVNFLIHFRNQQSSHQTKSLLEAQQWSI